MFLNYLRSRRGGGDAALLRVGSAPGPKAPSCVSGCVGRWSAEVCSLSVGSLSGATQSGDPGPRLASRTPQDAIFRPKTLQDAPKTLQDASKTFQDEPKTFQDRPRRPKRPPRRPKTPPRRDFRGFWKPKWSHVGTKNRSGSDVILKQRER